MPEKLHEKSCSNVAKETKPLSEDHAKKYLKELADWHMVDNATLIMREFTFPDFTSAFQFVKHVSEIAEDQNHHPDIAFGWGYCSITLQTHMIGGLHENDFIIASKIDKNIKKL